MNVPFVDLTREYASHKEDIDEAINGVLQSGWFVLGDEVSSFEREFAEYVGTDDAVGTNSGTDALQIGLEAVGVGPGDEVITVAHSFISTANAIRACGAEPVFVDINQDSYCMDTDEMRSSISEDTAAIVPVHLYGHPAEMDVVLDVAEEHDLAVVEDACQAHGARYRGQRVGTFGDVGCFSFYPVKNLGAYGDGGALVTDDADIAETARTKRNVGQVDRYQHAETGLNSRLDELQAAILRQKLPELDRWNRRRREVAATYREELRGSELTLPTEREEVEHVYHLFVVRHEDRDELRDHLSNRGVQTLIHYPTPIHQQPPYENARDRPLPRTERIADEIVSLPIHPWIEDEEVAHVIDAVNEFA